ncbi:MAG: tetratricopeptide repeat protein [Verrucomicrobia bacterium]|nr:tetratricopeptide repeat protein [Verrucomicrobiota bacterium]
MPAAFEHQHNAARPDALAIFTDRVEQRQLLRTILQPVPTSQLGPQYLLTQFYGVGGVGKSALCEQGRKIAEEEFEENVRVVSTSFDDSRWNEGTSFTDVATELCRCLVEKSKIVPRLTIALLALHGQQTGRNGEVVSGLDKGWSLAFTAMEKGINLTGIPGIGNVIKLAQWWRGKSQQNTLREKLASFNLWPEEQNGRLIVTDLESKLPGALFQDIREWLTENPSLHLCVMLDGFERLQGSERKADSQQRLQQWIGGFAASPDRSACDRFRAVIFGRNQLRWDEIYEDLGWRDCWTLHLLGGLAETDARDFLHKARTWLASNGQSAMAAAILRNEGQILDACDETKGGLRAFHPFYLNLAVELVERARQQGKEPELGRAPGELQDRFFRYLQPHELRALMILSLCEVFDEALFNWLARERLIDYPQHGFQSQLCREQPYFQPVEGSEGTWRFHRLMEDALHAKWHSTTELRKEAVPLIERLLEFYGNPLKEKPERDWTDADAETWRRGMEIIITQGPEMGLLLTETWRELLAIEPWSSDSFRCLNHRLDFGRRLIKENERNVGAEHPETLTCVNNLGAMLWDKGDYDRAERLTRRALQGREKALGSEHRDTLQSASNLGSMLWEKGDPDGAKELQKRTLEIQEKTLGAEHPDTLSSVMNLGVMLGQIGDCAGAEVLIRRALESREKTLGSEHPDTLNTVNNLANVLRRKGDYAGAEAFYRRTLETQENTLGPEHPDTLSSVINLGVLFKTKRDYAASEALYRRALEACDKVLGPEHPTTLTTISNLGGMLWAKGDDDGAERSIRRALRGREKTLGSEHRDTLQSAISLGMLLSRTKRRPEAVALLRSYASLSESAEDRVRYNLACYECLIGNCDEAKHLIEKHLHLHPEMKTHARHDPDFTAIQEFIKSLGL